ncbi:MAG TPA: hypothetical protein VFQ35_09785 [Polyangiaceae bacterium]|nr:hypothetical protein [Polyangiaceae bacterium]
MNSNRFALSGAFFFTAMVLAIAPARAESQAGSADANGSAPPTRAECLQAHQSAQELKRNEQFMEAQEQLAVCSSMSCPGAIISDCGQWISELEQRTPSMVFDVQLDGKQAPNAKLFVDNQPVSEWSKAYKVNPGRHNVRAELAPFPPHEETLVLPEGQRMRLVAIIFDSPKASAAPGQGDTVPPPVAVEQRRPTPGAVYPLLGVGVLGAASFTVFSLLGRSEQKALERDCAPMCTSSDMSAMKRDYVIGDLSAGVGAAALIGAAIVYFTRPSETVPTTGWSWNVGPAAKGDFNSFSLSAKQVF